MEFSSMLLSNEPYFNFSKIVQEYKLATIFSPDYSPSSYAWCTTAKKKALLRKNASGLLFNRVPKSASSTMSGVILRLAEKRWYRMTKQNTTKLKGCPRLNTHFP